MAGERRRRGAEAVAVLACMAMMLVHAEVARGETYIVGDGPGLAGKWTDNVERWTEGRHFVAGDMLVFQYDPTQQNVVVVDKQGYYNCRVSPPDAEVYVSGNDTVKVYGGMNYFISSLEKHCDSGVKIAVRGYDS